MKTNNEYLELIKQAKNKEIKLTKESYKQIQQIYKDVAKDLLIKSKKTNKKSLSERWLKDYRKAIKRALSEINKILNKNITDKIKKSAKLPSSVQLDFFSLIDNKYNLGMHQTFKNMFSRVPEEVVKELINGNIYKDGRGLSKRIWFANNKVKGDIQHIINKGIIEKKSAYELAKDIETYVNPQAKQDFKWKKVYPNIGNKKVDFNAQRLARTSINHAYFMSNVRSCSKNPFVECMHWELSLQHFIRMHGRTDICDEYANSDNYNLGTGNFPINKVPLPHPQCMCIIYAIIPDSMENIGTKLNKWVNGGSDNTLDEWFNKISRLKS